MAKIEKKYVRPVRVKEVAQPEPTPTPDTHTGSVLAPVSLLALNKKAEGIQVGRRLRRERAMKAFGDLVDVETKRLNV